MSIQGTGQRIVDWIMVVAEPAFCKCSNSLEETVVFGEVIDIRSWRSLRFCIGLMMMMIHNSENSNSGRDSI